MTEALVNESSDDNLANIVEEISQKLVSGNSDDIETILAEHPTEADRLRALLPTLRVLVEIGSSPVGQNRSNATVAETYSQEPLNQQILGDFRILREIGRGGMGVVFEAEQVSLRRRVALKVLPTASMLDPRSLQRFRNEAQAAASLHHSNIVPIHGVGCERGVHYYAMQYIDGLTIAEVIAKLRESSNLALDPQVQPQPHTAEADSQAQLDSKETRAVETEVMAALSTEKSSNSGAWFRRLAEHMAQVADALHHAHELGVTHRDIKPANLMLDRLGRIWVTDFGLARVEGADNLTMTGDLVGTLRYMSPEQALAKRLGVDHRSDIYSLGITLYELLTLKPAFAGAGRQELLQQLANDDPKSLRKQNPAIPRDLETIVIKATQKNPTERYQTAAELAADLRRFIDDRHIVARRPSLPVRAVRLAKRHKGLVSTVSVVLLLVAIGCLGWAYDYQQRLANTTMLVNEAIQEASLRHATAQANEDDLVAWEQALSAAERARVLAESGAVSQSLLNRVLRQSEALQKQQKQAQDRANNHLRNAKFMRALDEARVGVLFDPDDPIGLGMESSTTVRHFVQAFADYGIDLTKVNRQETLRSVKESSIRDSLLVGLIVAFSAQDENKSLNRVYISELATDVATSTWQKELIEAIKSPKTNNLQILAQSNELFDYPLEAAYCLELALLTASKDHKSAIEVARVVLQKYPGDFFQNLLLGELLSGIFHSPGQEFNPGNIIDPLRELAPEEAAQILEAFRFLTAAVAIRPDSARARKSLGSTLVKLKRYDEAIAALKEAIRLKPTYAGAHQNLGNVYSIRGQLDAAVESYNEAIRLEPKSAVAYCNLGTAFQDQNKLDEAVSAFRESIRLKPSSIGHTNLGAALFQQGKLEEATADYRIAIHLDPANAQAHSRLGNALCEQKKYAEGEAEIREAFRLQPSNVGFQLDLGTSLKRQGKLDDAGNAYREAIRIKPTYARAHRSLANTLSEQDKLKEGEAACREAIRLDPSDAESYFTLGHILQKQRRLADALTAYHEALRLMPTHAKAMVNLGNVLENQGKQDEAAKQFRAALVVDPTLPEARNALGNDLLARGRTDEAIAEFRVAIQNKPESFQAHNGLGAALMMKREFGKAITAFRAALRIKSEYPEALCNLGLALSQFGNHAEALEVMRKGHELGSRNPDWPYPSRQWLNRIENIQKINKDYDAILENGDPALSAADRIEVAQFAMLTKHDPVIAVKCFQQAFMDDRSLLENLQAGHRYNAACTALLAAAAKQKEANQSEDSDHMQLPHQALVWLQADVDAYKKLTESAPPGLLPQLINKLTHWEKDPDLESLRNDDQVRKLLAEDQELCKKLWSDHAELLKQLREKQSSIGK